MNARSILIAVAIAVEATSVAAAEPAKPSRPESATPRETAAPVLMASANVDRATEAAGAVAAAAPQGTSVPAKRPRAVRVTTCRCADTPNP